MRDLPNIYAKARGLRVYVSGKSQTHMLQVLCNTSIAIPTTLVG